LDKAKHAGAEIKAAGKEIAGSRQARMFGRNTVASTISFLLDLAILAALVELAGVPHVVAASIAFIIPLIVFYFLQREWVFPGTHRGVASGFVYFLINMGIGFAAMLAVFWTLLEVTELHYLVARVLASVVYGIVVFVLNGVFNFKQL
jgi:putative flippase GtrA